MGKQILFLEKNAIDFANPQVLATATQANEFASYVTNRSNTSAWVTSGSVDADNTQLEVDFGDNRYIDTVLLIKHNFKNYVVHYWDGFDWIEFVTVVNNTLSSTHHERPEVMATRIRVTITGTMVANQDKSLCQLIVTTKIAQLNGWPVIAAPRHERTPSRNKMLSGKMHMIHSVGSFSCDLNVAFWRDLTDLLAVERLFFSNDPFLVWLCGGDEEQFFAPLRGYRLEDVYLMKCANDYSPEWVKGIYSNGVNTKIKLVEVT